MDFQTHRAEMLAHYTRLAAIPGWRPYVKHRLQEMAKLDAGLYGDFTQLITEALKPPTQEQP